MVKKLLFSPSSSVPEKSSTTTFAHTCNLLSQYLKSGKPNLGHFDLAAKFDHHPSFHYNSSSSSAPAAPTTTLDLLPGIGCSTNGYGSTPAGGGGAQSQMTIFYGGKVIVFNDLPAEKAKEIMGLVSLSEQQNNNTAAAASSSSSPQGGQMDQQPMGHLQQARSIGSDLPIARRASLHRFLEKRKDRVTARGPYHHESVKPVPAEEEEEANNKSRRSNSRNGWVDGEMSQSAKQLELSL